MRLTSAGAPGWNFSPPQPTGSPRRNASRNAPAGGVISSSAAEMLRAGSNPPSNRAASSLT